MDNGVHNSRVWVSTRRFSLANLALQRSIIGLCVLIWVGGWPSRAMDTELPGGHPTRAVAGLFGPFRTDPAHGVPKHAYSPFDKTTASASVQPVAGRDFVTGRVVVKLKAPEASLTRSINGLPDLAALGQRFGAYGLSAVERVFPSARPAGGAAKALAATIVTPQPDLTRWLRMRCDTKADILELARTLADDPDVEWAEPDYTRKLTGDGLPDATTDVLYSQQWHLGAAHISEAWAYLQSQGLPPGGSRSVVVAVIDTGVDYTHEDLATNLWVNTREIPGNGVDDDGNGYVDDVYGLRVEGTHSGNPADDHGHGTHVAGIIAARGNNGYGGVGVAYNVRIMAIKAAQYSGQLAASDIAEGIQYAVAKGADIINMSFGAYYRSMVEEDALAVAFGQCVLVAAAGNDGYPNEGIDLDPVCSPARAKAMYPAAYNWVIGVMASTPIGTRAQFSNFDCKPRNTVEYEVAAPGVDIWSTLPGNQYAAWDGTSVAAPIVSGIAALARSKWGDKDLYSSRFIMGQIVANAEMGTNSVVMVNALKALTVAPKPLLTYMEHWSFDTTNQAAINDQDGRVDAGETVDLAVEIRNHWGKASNVVVRLDAWAPGAVLPDPYVNWLKDTVDYGAIGAFNWDDNGLIYSNQTIVGVQYPFRFQVATNCANDHVIPLRLRMNCRNGFDAADTTDYAFTNWFSLVVQRGRELPRVITNDMTLTKSDYWIVPDQTLVAAGATLTITEGAQVQFYTSDPKSPYSKTGEPVLQVEGSLVIRGTAQEPVEIFTDEGHRGNTIRILQKVSSTASVQIYYAEIFNPVIGDSTSLGGQFFDSLYRIDHCRFRQDFLEGLSPPPSLSQRPVVACSRTSNSFFDHLGALQSPMWLAGTAEGAGALAGNCFDSCTLYLHSNYVTSVTGNVFLKNSKVGTNNVVRGSEARGVGTLFDPRLELQFVAPTNMAGGSAYAIASMGTAVWTAELFAQYLGGNLATINDAAENSFLSQYASQTSKLSTNAFNALYPDLAGRQGEFNGPAIIGLTDLDLEGRFEWMSGAPVTYVNWGSGQPQNSSEIYDYVYLQGSWYSVSSYSTSYRSKLLEFPGQWTRDQLLSARENFVAQHGFNRVTNNAFLNVWMDPDPTHWLQFKAGKGRDETRYLSKNYWGTTSRTLIDAAITDFNDDFNLNRYVYEPILTTAPADAYPFVVDVLLSNLAGEPLTTVGAETVNFTVIFNRPMDTNTQPQVSFGPGTPFTDYRVPSLEAGWRDPWTWVGRFSVSPATGDGYQWVRVAAAVAADDPWLVTADDGGRFRFEIRTSGASAVHLSVAGGVGRVDLSWSQDDFELLAGYNLYRSTNSVTDFSRLNAALIPAQVRTFADTNVVPGRPYFYKFTVVKSDMSESAFSNLAQGTALDTIPPVITHSPVTNAAPGLPLTLFADVTDNVGVQSVMLYFRAVGTDTFGSRTLVRTVTNRYAATIEGGLVNPPGLEYYLEASDGISLSRVGSPASPRSIVVVDRPVVTSVSPVRGPAKGGTLLAVMGANFKTNAAVVLGGAPATEVTRVSVCQINCRAPAHAPALVDVVVTNPGGQSGTLLQGYTYENSGVVVGISNSASAKGSSVSVPVTLNGVEGLAAAELTLTFDGAVLRGRGAQTGTLTPGWSLAVNTNIPGQIRLSMASPGSFVSGSGQLAILDLEVVGAPGSTSVLHWASVSLNDGAIQVSTNDGSFTVLPVYQVSGTVTYWKTNVGVPGVLMTLGGDRVYTALAVTNGTYAATGALAGAYTLTPTKADQVYGITAYDASLMLQQAAGSLSLTGLALTAADVNRNGIINSMDAYLVLQYAVGLQPLPFPGAGGVWVFSPTNLSFQTLNSSRPAQNFTGVLLGDVSGNWRPTGAVGLGRLDLGDQAAVGLRTLPASAGTRQVYVILRAMGAPIYSLELSLAGCFPTGNQEVRSGPLGEGLLRCVNTNEAGSLRVALAGAVPVRGVGALLILTVPEVGSKDLEIATVSINEGEIAAKVDPTGALFNEDTDGDGQSDWDEIRAGTDPTDSQSRFCIQSVWLNPDGSRTVRWSAVPGKTYQVWSCDSTMGRDWQPVGAAFKTEKDVGTVTDEASAESARLYRVQLVE